MRILRVGEVAKKIGGSVAWVWRKSKDDPEFPKPVKISPNITGWIETELDEYLTCKVTEHRAAPGKSATVDKAAAISAERRRAAA
jgi:prophage regulatory protein